MPQITIREMEKRDAKRVAELTRQLTKNIVKPEELQSRIENAVKQKNAQWIVAEKDGQVEGSGGLIWYSIHSKGMMGMIEEVVVDQDCRSNGIGQLMVGCLLKLAEHLGLTQVKLTTANGKAMSLYLKNGFIDKGEILMVKKYY